MRAVVFHRYGPPDVLRIEDVERPAPARGEVLVRVHATTVGRADCATREANRRSGVAGAALSRLVFGIRGPRFHTLGSDFAGVVEALGEGVTTFAVGDRVFGTTGLRFGAHAEYVRVRAERAIAPMPADATFAQAAAICDGGLNAITSLQRVGVRAGQRVLVYGASGSIGTSAVQLAKVMGAEVTAVCSTEKVDVVQSLGPDRVIDRRREDFTASGETYDVIFDAVGKLTFGRCRRSLAPRGVFVATDGFGNTVRSIVTRATRGQRVVFPIPRLSSANTRYLGELAGSGRYRPVIDRVYPLVDVVEATTYVETERKTGNVVLEVVGEEAA